MASNSMAKNLRILRERVDYSQAEVSSYLNISQPAYQKYESGLTEVSMEALEKLAQLYGVDEYEIMEGNVEQMQMAGIFAFRRNGIEGNLEDVSHFQQIVKNYLMICNELEKNK